MQTNRNTVVATKILIAMFKERRHLEHKPALTPAQYRHLMTLRELDKLLDAKRN